MDFSNTTGTKIICQARGVPLPNITWTKANGEPIGTVPGLRQVIANSKYFSFLDAAHLLRMNVNDY